MKESKMIKDTLIILLFYLAAISLSISSGFIYGFSNSHIPPVPFLLGAVFVFIGLLWFSFQLLLTIAKGTKVKDVLIIHLVGLAINILFLASLWVHGTM
jgi:hypothetical protein